MAQPAGNHTLTALLAAIALLLLGPALDQAGDVLAARAEYARWHREACIPTEPHQVAISRIEGGRLRCSVIDNAGYGKSATRITVASMERP